MKSFHHLYSGQNISARLGFETSMHFSHDFLVPMSSHCLINAVKSTVVRLKQSLVLKALVLIFSQYNRCCLDTSQLIVISFNHAQPHLVLILNLS